MILEGGTLKQTMAAKSKSVPASPLQSEIHHVRDLLRKGCPVGVTEHPSAFALAPGGDFRRCADDHGHFERGQNGHSKRAPVLRIASMQHTGGQ
jgi:hypothetical protein